MPRKFISALLIIIGLAIILYPLGRNYYADYHLKKLIDEWEATSHILSKELPLADNGEEKEQGVEEKALQEYISQNVEGILKIDKINLELPILKGTSEKNLLISAGSMDNTSEVGEIGNYAIAGHRNYGYGRHFNRLDELSSGDIIRVRTDNAEYSYEVTDKLYVNPEDVWVLEANGIESEITLITCHPVKNPTHRLIVKGKIVKLDAKSDGEKVGLIYNYSK